MTAVLKINGAEYKVNSCDLTKSKYTGHIFTLSPDYLTPWRKYFCSRQIQGCFCNLRETQCEPTAPSALKGTNGS